MPKLIALAIIPALWVALWADLAAAEVISACLKGNTGQIIKAQIGGKPTHPCIGWQKPVTIPLYSVEPSPQELRRGLVLDMPVTADFIAFPEEFEDAIDVVTVSGGSLAVHCAAEVNAGSYLAWFFIPNIAGTAMSVQGSTIDHPLQLEPGALYLIHESIVDDDNGAFPLAVDTVPHASFVAPDGSQIILEMAEAHLNTDDGTCVAKGRVTYQDGEP